MFCVVGLFLGRFIFSIAELFALAGWIVTGLFVVFILIAFALLQKLHAIEMRVIVGGVSRLTGAQTEPIRIEDDAVMRTIKAVAIGVGSLVGVLVSAIWSPDVIGALLSF